MAEDGVRFPDELIQMRSAEFGMRNSEDRGECLETPFRTPHSEFLRPGVVTEACRSDKAAAVVRLHLGPCL